MPGRDRRRGPVARLTPLPLPPRRRWLAAGAAGVLGRLGTLRAGASLLLAAAVRPSLASTVTAVRVWPAAEYTRVTIETEATPRWSAFTMRDPDRLVVDLESLTLDAALRDLVAKVRPDDPWLRRVRVGQPRAGIVRLVLDLHGEIDPQVFALEPAGQYRHRLVLDLYPRRPPDALDELLARAEDREGQLDALLAQVDPSAPRPVSPRPAPSPAGATASGATAAPSAPRPVPPTLLPPPAPATAVAPGITAPVASPTGRAAAAVPSEAMPDGTTARVDRLLRIAIDPGHGGEDPGAIGPASTQEKNVTLEIARRLRALVDAEPAMRAMLTRDGDFFVPLGVRVAKARRVRADLFVSIHADAFVTPTARGASVFVLSEHGASSTAARWLAAKENGADLIGGANLGKAADHEVRKLLLELSTSAQIADSLKIGRTVLDELRGVGNLHKSAVERAGFAVLKAPDIPSILVETAFISNPDEEARLADVAYQQQIADAIFRGIRAWLRRHPPAGIGRST